ncbi:MAG: DUF6326 family protein [Chloroflexota bacterium]
MSNRPDDEIDPSQPPVYQIKIEGQLDQQWKDWFEGLSIQPEKDGGTLLTGPVIDQAALHGLIKKVRDLGLPLVSIRQVRLNETHRYDAEKGETMGAIREANLRVDVKMKLSALWVALMLLYIYADIFSLHRPGQIQTMVSGRMGPFAVTQATLFGFSILMMIPAVMVFLSLTLKPVVNRWVNIVLGVLYTLVNLSNLIGETWAFYIGFGLVEIVLTLLIAGYAWQQRGPEYEAA